MKLVDGFFYGLYMDEDLLRTLGFNPVSSHVAKADSYEINLNGMAKIIPKKGTEVWGKLITLPENELKAMYSFETTKDYKPEIINILTEEGKPKTATCYNMVASELDKLNIEYLSKLVVAAKKLELPYTYIKQLESIHAKNI